MQRTSFLTVTFVLVSACLLAGPGCKSEQAEEITPPPVAVARKAPGAAAAQADRPGEGMVVALVMKTMTNPFFQRMDEGAKQKADELGVELISVASARETDIDEQVNKVLNMIQKGVDAILVAPAGSKEIVPVLVKSKEAGIITINLDNRVDPEAAAAAGLELDTFVGPDNVEGGYKATKHLAELMGSTGVATMLEGIPSADNAIARREGFEKAMAEYEGKIELIKPFQSAHWEQEEAYNIMSNLLRTHPELTGLFCANDMMALGAMRAIDDAGRTGTIHVVAYDNLPEVQDALKNGRLEGTIEQHPEMMGSMGVDLAVRIHNGEKVEKEYPVPVDLITPEIPEKAADPASSA